MSARTASRLAARRVAGNAAPLRPLDLDVHDRADAPLDFERPGDLPSFDPRAPFRVDGAPLDFDPEATVDLPDNASDALEPLPLFGFHLFELVLIGAIFALGVGLFWIGWPS